MWAFGLSLRLSLSIAIGALDPRVGSTGWRPGTTRRAEDRARDRQQRLPGGALAQPGERCAGDGADPA